MAEVENKAPVTSPAPAAANQTSVLIIDDSSLQAKAVEKLLRQLGVGCVHYCDDPFHAIPILKERSVDIIFCDWNMPGCTGLELWNAIRKEPDIGAIPFVLLTANSQKEQVIEAVRAGIKDYVVKPATKEVLETKLKLIQRPA